MKKSNYITREGWNKLDKELKYLWKEERPLITRSVSEAAAQGDRSENAEYISAKEMIRNIDKRLRFLEKIINNSQVVLLEELLHKKVNFGSEVQLLDLITNEEKTYLILGTHETNPNENIISNKSPLGSLLLGKELNEEFEFKIGDKTFEYEVLKIKKASFK